MEKFRLVINPGHTPENPGAQAFNLSEHTEAKKVIEKLVPMLGKFEILSLCDGLTAEVKKIKEFNPLFAIDLHFNAFNGKASGTEVLVHPNRSENTYDLANSITDSISTVLDIKNRGVKIGWDRNNPNKTYYLLEQLPTIGLIVEVLFIDNKKKDALYLLNNEHLKIASALAIGIKRSIILQPEVTIRK